MEPIPVKNRIEALDSMRFLAAFAVFLSHGIAFFPRLPWLDIPFATAFLDPKAAVMFFFVLSGYVLQSSAVRAGRSARNYCAFVIRRAFRIYPLFLVSLALALVAVTLVRMQGIPSDPGLFGDVGAAEVMASDHTSVGQWIYQLSLVAPGFDMHFLNPPTWTLSVEMRIALILPVLAVTVSKASLKLQLILLVASLPVCFYVGSEFFGTISLIPLFLMGSVLHGYIGHIRPASALKYAVYLLGFLILYPTPGYRSELGIPDEVTFFASGIGSCCAILAVLQSRRLKRYLGWGPLATLGGWSYGIYLLHFPILLGIASVGASGSPGIAVVQLAASLALSITIAGLAYRWIELPSIQRGKIIANLLSDNN